jgi:signal peptidase I
VSPSAGRGKSASSGAVSGKARSRTAGNAAANSALTAKTGKKRSKSTTGAIVELAVIIAVALGLALGIQAFLIKPYRIPSGSMEPTLAVGQRVLVNRIGMDLGKPHVGEIAVFHPPEGAENQECGPVLHDVTPGGEACVQSNPKEASVNFIKRIVAGPGDEMYIKEGHVFRRAAGTSQFVAEKDSYIRPCAEPASLDCNFPKVIKVPAGHWFMMGDNRGESDDSRFWGPVPTGWVIGQAIATYWPPDRIGIF